MLFPEVNLAFHVSWDPSKSFYHVTFDLSQGHLLLESVGFGQGSVGIMPEGMSNVSFPNKYFLPPFIFPTIYNLPHLSCGFNAVETILNAVGSGF